jgi:hypothetical protein
MQIVETPGASQRLRRLLRRSDGYFQETFRTPLQQLASFTRTVIAVHGPPESGSVIVEQVVFTPKSLEGLLTGYDLPLTYGRDWTITATGPEEISALLEAAWGDWLDFYFTPTPKRFHLFADHDEYTTIFGATKGHVSKLATALVSAGFSRVDGYEREW